MTWEEIDRREFPRASYPCLITVSQIFGPAERILTHTQNISATGVCVVIREELSAHSVVGLEIDLMDGQDTVSCRGSICWIAKKSKPQLGKLDRYETGIRFVNLREKDRVRLARIIALLLSRQRQK
jgi:c-di-GMP-binding flagellar brake protein YcgR